MVSKMDNPGGHEPALSVGEIEVIITEKKKIRKITPGLVSGETFVIGHKIADTGDRIFKVGF